jgi:hypothetical protein
MGGSLSRTTRERELDASAIHLGCPAFALSHRRRPIAGSILRPDVPASRAETPIRPGELRGGRCEHGR